MADKDIRITPRSNPKRDRGPGSAQPQEDGDAGASPAQGAPQGANPIAAHRKLVAPSSHRVQRRESRKKFDEYFNKKGTSRHHREGSRRRGRRSVARSPFVAWLVLGGVLCALAGLGVYLGIIPLPRFSTSIVPKPAQAQASEAPAEDMNAVVAEGDVSEAEFAGEQPFDEADKEPFSSSMLASEVLADPVSIGISGVTRSSALTDKYDERWQELNDNPEATDADYEQFFADALADNTADPQMVIATFQKYFAYLNAKGIDRTSPVFRRAIPAYIDKLEDMKLIAVEEFIFLGDLYMQLPEIDKGIATYKRALEVDPLSSPALQKLAFTYAAQGEQAEATEYLERIVEAEPSNVSARKAYAMILFEQERFDDAVIHMRLACSLDPNDERMTTTYAVLLAEKLQRHDEALSFTLNALRRFPRNPLLNATYAMSLYQSGQLAPAMPAIERALALAPETNPPRWKGMLLLMLGNVHNEQGSDTKALENYMLAMDTMQNPPLGLYNNIAYLWAKRSENLDQALEYASKAVEGHPEEVSMLDTIGFVHLQRKEFEKALSYLERAYSLAEEKNADLLLHYGDALENTGNFTKAREIWLEASGLEPDNPEIIKRLNQ